MGIIIPTDELIFFSWVGIPPTRAISGFLSQPWIETPKWLVRAYGLSLEGGG
jgi:hypothetical protein